MANEWTPLYSKPLKPATWKKLSSAALPTPAEKARLGIADLEAKVKWHDEADKMIRQAQNDLDAKGVNRDWMLRTLPAELAEMKRTRRQLGDVQDEVARLILDNETLKLAVEQAKTVALMAAGSEQMIGESPVQVEGNKIGLDWSKASFGVRKAGAARVWVHNGYIRGADTYHFVDSAALALSDTSPILYVNMTKQGVTSIGQAPLMPDDTTTDYRWPLVRLARTDPSGDSNYTWAIRKIYSVGDVPVKPMIHDADSPYGDSYQSLEKKLYSNSHYGEDQIYQFVSHSTYRTNYDSFGIDVNKYEAIARFRNATGKAQVRYLDLSRFKAYDALTADYAANAGQAENVTNLYEHLLEDHTDYHSSGAKSAGRVPMCLDDANWTWQDAFSENHTDISFYNEGIGWAAIGTGKSGGNTDHDDVYWRTFNDGSGIAGHNNFIDSKTYKTSGRLEVTNATPAYLGGAIYASNGCISGEQGCYFAKGSAEEAGLFSSGYGLTQVALASEGYAIDALGDVNISGNIQILDGDYYHATSIGVTITNWIGGGIVTGASITEINASDLQPTDKILVIR